MLSEKGDNLSIINSSALEMILKHHDWKGYTCFQNPMNLSVTLENCAGGFVNIDCRSIQDNEQVFMEWLRFLKKVEFMGEDIPKGFLIIQKLFKNFKVYDEEFVVINDKYRLTLDSIFEMDEEEDCLKVLRDLISQVKTELL